MDPLALLERPDNWFLGGGKTLIYAPPFPQHLETPGLWDDAHLLDFVHPRPFTWTLLDEDDREIPLRFTSRSWRPDRMTRTWVTPQGLTVTEEAYCLAENFLAADVTITNDSDTGRDLDFVFWTIQQHDGPNGIEQIRGDFAAGDSGISFTREVVPTRRGKTLPPVSYRVHLVSYGWNISSYIAMSQRNSLQPHWRLAPFPEHIEGGVMGDDRLFLPDSHGSVYFGVINDLQIAAHTKQIQRVGCLFDAEARHRALSSIGFAPYQDSTKEWRRWFAGVPHFECSDPYLTNAYWYRWYGLRLNAIEPPADGPWEYKHPAVCEGIEYFRDLISYSAQVHMRELRWMHDPRFARGSLRNFLDHQKPDGNFPGNIYATFVHNDDMYHADWGRALLAVHEIHPDGAFLEEAYEPLCRYARFILRERDPESSHLYDVVNQWETGQEYMHRYTAVDPHADGGNELRPHLKGVDATLYLYNLFRALAEIAAALEKPDEAAEWTTHADATEQAMRTLMWDGDTGMFSDVNAATMQRTDVRAAVDFYPFLTLDLGTDEYLRAFREHLLNPEEFWTPFPVPAEAASDPAFSAEPYWRGERKNCPWNGRVWPMTNSHVCEALARTAQEYAPDLLPAAAEMLRRFVRMMTVDGDPARPNCYEHYNPMNGTAAYYRGIDDYMHSYLVDLIIRFVAGVQPHADGTLVVNPLPMDLGWFALTGVPYRGHRIDVLWDAGSGLSVKVDGVSAGGSNTLMPLPITIFDETAG